MPGNPEEFLNLLKQHYRDALQYCRALCRDPHEAQDLLQQSLVQALEKLSGLRETSHFKSWYFKIITNTFYTQRRRSFWRRFLPLPVPNNQPHLPAVFLEEPDNTRQQLLFLALQKLSAKERAAILLFEVGEFSIQEIADIQEEKTLSAVKSRLSRTRLKLKDLICLLEKNTDLNLKPVGDITDETEKLTAEFSRR